MIRGRDAGRRRVHEYLRAIKGVTRE
jgi:hypothetical protein